MRVKVTLLTKYLGLSVPIAYFHCDTFVIDKDMEYCIDLHEKVKGSYRNMEYCWKSFIGSIYVEEGMAVYYQEELNSEWKIIMDRR